MLVGRAVQTTLMQAYPHGKLKTKSRRDPRADHEARGLDPSRSQARRMIGVCTEAAAAVQFCGKEKLARALARRAAAE